MKTMCAKMGDNIFQGIINMNEDYRERMMKTTTYKAAQQAYDRMELITGLTMKMNLALSGMNCLMRGGREEWNGTTKWRI
jgi:hypothetical protein